MFQISITGILSKQDYLWKRKHFCSLLTNLAHGGSAATYIRIWGHQFNLKNPWRDLNIQMNICIFKPSTNHVFFLSGTLNICWFLCFRSSSLTSWLSMPRGWSKRRCMVVQCISYTICWCTRTSNVTVCNTDICKMFHLSKFDIHEE
jgi:hypothetical protein